MACVTEPFELSKLCALTVLEKNIEWENRLLDELSRETIRKLVPLYGSPALNLRRGRAKEFIPFVGSFIENFYETYEECLGNTDRITTFAILFYNILPTADVLRLVPQKTKDKILEIILFWSFSFPNFLTDDFLTALCE
nr:hypothetical protein MarFTME_244 [Marseillevirus futianmevirus]